MRIWRGDITVLDVGEGPTYSGVGIQGAVWYALAAAVAGVALLALVSAAFLFRRGYRPMVPAPVSEDGNWWWDGREWRHPETIPR